MNYCMSQTLLLDYFTVYPRIVDPYQSGFHTGLLGGGGGGEVGGNFERKN